MSSGWCARRQSTWGVFPSLGPVAGIHSEVLFTEPLALVVAPSHPLAGRRSIEPAELSQHAFVCGLRESQHFRMIDQVLRQIGVATYDIAMELQDFAAVREVARHGGGIACEMFTCVREEIDAGQLVPLRLTGPRPSLEIRCAFRSPMPGPAQQFVELLKNSRRR
jgi:DNA-binding transcriptional LysR family regulator